MDKLPLPPCEAGKDKQRPMWKREGKWGEWGQRTFGRAAGQGGEEIVECRAELFAHQIVPVSDESRGIVDIQTGEALQDGVDGAVDAEKRFGKEDIAAMSFRLRGQGEGMGVDVLLIQGVPVKELMKTRAR